MTELERLAKQAEGFIDSGFPERDALECVRAVLTAMREPPKHFNADQRGTWKATIDHILAGGVQTRQAVSVGADSAQQRLVDLCFSMCLALQRDREWLARQSREDVAAWVAKTLADMGFPTHPVGSSWGVLERGSQVDYR